MPTRDGVHLMPVHTMPLKFFIAYNGLHGIQCNCYVGQLRQWHKTLYRQLYVMNNSQSQSHRVNSPKTFAVCRRGRQRSKKNAGVTCECNFCTVVSSFKSSFKLRTRFFMAFVRISVCTIICAHVSTKMPCSWLDMMLTLSFYICSTLELRVCIKSCGTLHTLKLVNI